MFWRLWLDGTLNVLDRHSLFFASRGANIVVNDFNAKAAQDVVDQITKGLRDPAALSSCLTASQLAARLS